MSIEFNGFLPVELFKVEYNHFVLAVTALWWNTYGWNLLHPILIVINCKLWELFYQTLLGLFPPFLFCFMPSLKKCPGNHKSWLVVIFYLVLKKYCQDSGFKWSVTFKDKSWLYPGSCPHLVTSSDKQTKHVIGSCSYGFPVSHYLNCRSIWRNIPVDVSGNYSNGARV